MLFLDIFFFFFWCFKPLLGWGKLFSRLSHNIGPLSLGIRAPLGKRRGEATGGRTMGATSQSWARRAGGGAARRDCKRAGWQHMGPSGRRGRRVGAGVAGGPDYKCNNHIACITDLVDSHKTSNTKSCIYKN